MSGHTLQPLRFIGNVKQVLHTGCEKPLTVFNATASAFITAQISFTLGVHKMNQKPPLEEAQQRIQLLKKILKQHKKNIALLQGFVEGQLTLKNEYDTSGVESYTRNRRDEQRLAWILNYLKMRMQFYQRELEILQK